jgi:hypothetical protein
MFRQVVLRAEQLDVFGDERRTTLGVRNDVVKVKVRLAATLHAFSFVTLPYSEFHCRWDHPIVF